MFFHAATKGAVGRSGNGYSVRAVSSRKARLARRKAGRQAAGRREKGALERTCRSSGHGDSRRRVVGRRIVGDFGGGGGVAFASAARPLAQHAAPGSCVATFPVAALPAHYRQHPLGIRKRTR